MATPCNFGDRLGIDPQLNPDLYHQVSTLDSERDLLNLAKQDKGIAAFILRHSLSMKREWVDGLRARLFYQLGSERATAEGFEEVRGVEAVLRERGLLNYGAPIADGLDLFLICGQEVLSASKAVLSASSPYFQAALSHGFREQETGIVDLNSTHLKPEAIKTLLKITCSPQAKQRAMLRNQDLLAFLQTVGAAEYLKFHELVGGWQALFYEKWLNEQPLLHELPEMEAISYRLGEPALALLTRMRIEAAPVYRGLGDRQQLAAALCRQFIERYIRPDPQGGGLLLETRSMSEPLRQFTASFMGSQGLGTELEPTEVVPEEGLQDAHKQALQAALGLRRPKDYGGRRCKKDFVEAIERLGAFVAIVAVHCSSTQILCQYLRASLPPREVLEYAQLAPDFSRFLLSLILKDLPEEEQNLLNTPNDILCLSAVQFACFQGPETGNFPMRLDLELLTKFAQSGGDFLRPTTDDIHLPGIQKEKPCGLELLLGSLHPDQLQAPLFRRFLLEELWPRMIPRQRKAYEALVTEKTGLGPGCLP